MAVAAREGAGIEGVSTTTCIRNPVIWADFPDPDVIRVGEWFYMVTTSMHTMPGCPIMRSRDLKHWELVGYVFDTLEENAGHTLVDGRGVYGKGAWAPSLRYHDGTFYVAFSSNDTGKFYIYRTCDIERGPWERTTIPRLFHDPSLLFDDGRVYVIYGNGDIYITELTKDLTGVKEDGLHRQLLSTPAEGMILRCEGCHAYRIGDTYYLLFIEWPRTGHARRRQVCYRAKHLLGPYERRVILDDDGGYHNKGVAQGAIVDTPGGDWYAVLFQDHDAVGRIPHVLPVTWNDGWPIAGVDAKAPQEVEVALPEHPLPVNWVTRDGFDHPDGRLPLAWQWNHNPDHRYWSLTERPGCLRLYTSRVVRSVLQAPNTLTQRTVGPACRAEIDLDASRMKPGDHAGLIALQSHFGTVGVRCLDEGKAVEMCVREGDGGERVVERAPLPSDRVRLRIDFDFRGSVDVARFYFALPGGPWRRIGSDLAMRYTLDHFMGYRIGIFCYASRTTGGWVDVDEFEYVLACSEHLWYTGVETQGSS